MISIMFFFSCSTSSDLPVVKNFEIERYTGVWYEAARLPNRFERNLDRVTAEYNFREDGRINVVNTGFIIGEDTKKTASGIAKIPDKNIPSRIKVSFFRPFWADYLVLAIDENYMHALVGSSSLKYLWILSRNKDADPKVVEEFIETASSLGFNVEELIMVNQK